ncbi:DeoR/GlpR family DNA-binding transcription regulator [Oscillospiraceae bacterium MB08-C2-2]|nr:DeoR/GlpR family DNA-binding transcription regulator [Oscillospiraceae bacterium MB08-C2-2]
MKMNEPPPLFAEERRDHILRLLEERAKITVPELCLHFSVSPATIRTDLRGLESEGRLRRTHGGAVPVSNPGLGANLPGHTVICLEEKRRIARYAASLVDEGDTIAMDTGSTLMELAKELVNKQNLSVITNDTEIALFLENHSTAEIFLVGGSLRREYHCTTGPLAVSMLSGLNVDKAFIASNAFLPDKGFTTPLIDQAEIKRSMMRIAAQTIMLMDSSKIGKISFLKFADLAEVDKLITDRRMDKEMAYLLRNYDQKLDLITV